MQSKKKLIYVASGLVAFAAVFALMLPSILHWMGYTLMEAGNGSRWTARGRSS